MKISCIELKKLTTRICKYNSFHKPKTFGEYINAPFIQCRRNLRTHQSPVMFDLCLRKTWANKSRDYRDVTVPEKLNFQKCIHQTKTKSRRFHVPTVLEKLYFQDGLIVDGRPSCRNKAAFSNFSGAMPKQSPLSPSSIDS